MVVVWVSNARGEFRLLLHGSPCQRAAEDPAWARAAGIGLNFATLNLNLSRSRKLSSACKRRPPAWNIMQLAVTCRCRGDATKINIKTRD